MFRLNKNKKDIPLMNEPDTEINMFSKINNAINEYTDQNGYRPLQIILSESAYMELCELYGLDKTALLGIFVFVDYNSTAKPFVLCNKVPKSIGNLIYYYACPHCGHLFNCRMWTIAAKHVDCPSCKKGKISEYRPV